MNNSDSTNGEFFLLKLGKKKASLGIVWMHLIKRLIMLILLTIIIIAMLHLAVGKDCVSLSMILGKM